MSCLHHYCPSVTVVLLLCSCLCERVGNVNLIIYLFYLKLGHYCTLTHTQHWILFMSLSGSFLYLYLNENLKHRLSCSDCCCLVVVAKGVAKNRNPPFLSVKRILTDMAC